jgi:hypothetical protein
LYYRFKWLVAVFFGKNWQMTMNIEISIFPRKKSNLGDTAYAIIAPIGTKASKSTLFA